MKKSLISLAAGLLLASSAQATVYTFQYTAKISSLTQGVYGAMVPVTASTVPGTDILISDTIIGTISYDSANTRQWYQFVSPSYNKALYQDETIVFSMGNARTGQMAVASQTEIGVLDSRNAAQYTDSVGLYGSVAQYTPNYVYQYLNMSFAGSSIDVLSRARLPGEELTEFESATFSYQYDYSFEDHSYQSVLAEGSITSIKLIDTPALVSAVPEPGTYAMLLAGLGLLAWQRRRHG